MRRKVFVHVLIFSSGAMDPSLGERLLQLASIFRQCQEWQGQTLANYVSEHCKGDMLKKLEILGLPGIVFTGIYNVGTTDGYEYRHCHLPPHISKTLRPGQLLSVEELYSIPGFITAPGWEHYAVWTRERNILLLRRQKVAANKASIGCQTLVVETVQADMVAEEVVDQVLPEGPIHILPTPQLVAPGGQALGDDAKLDEYIAASGLSPKLHMDQIPELIALVKHMEARYRDWGTRAQAAGMGAKVMARVFVILRCIRGVAGIEWASKMFAEQDADFFWFFTQACGAEALASVASRLLDLDPNGAENWMAHREGRHAGLSGARSLEALAKEPRKAAQLAMLLEPLLVVLILKPAGDRSPVAFSNSMVLHALTVAHGRLPLRINAASGAVSYASDYNATNVGWMFLAWPWRTGRARFEVCDETFWWVQSSQSNTAQQAMSDFAVDSAASFKAKWKALSSCSRSSFPHSDEFGDCPCDIFPGCVFVHMCECGQLRHAISDDVISLLVRGTRWSMPRVRRVAAMTLSRIMQQDKVDLVHYRSCLTLRVFRAVQEALAKTRLAIKGKQRDVLPGGELEVRPQPCNRQRLEVRHQPRKPNLAKARKWLQTSKTKKQSKKGATSAQSSLPGQSALARLGGVVKDRKQDGRCVTKPRGRWKDRVQCDVCGRWIRKDGWSRHKKSCSKL